MKDRRAFLCVDQQVFPAASHGDNGLTRQVTVDVFGNRPAQAPLTNHDARNRRVDDMRLDATATGFDFG
jgi:hypothetical protein